MNPIAWLIGLILPACGFPAAEGLPTPPLMNPVHITRPSTPNTALAAPQGFQPTPDIVTPAYTIQPARLFALVQAVAAAQPRTYQAALYPGHLQADYVARSRVFNFPDQIMVQVQPQGTDHSTLILWSRSVYGQSDFGVNKQRLRTWLAALATELPPSTER